MAAADTSFLDLSGFDSAATTETVETPAVETTETTSTTETTGTEVTSTENTTGTESTESTEELNADGTKKEVTGKETAPTPQSIRTLLKTMRDSDPKNAAAVKALHTEYERAQAYGKVYKTVQAAREAQAFIESVGGQEGYEAVQQEIAAVEASDQLLYAGDAKLIDNIVADLKKEGHIDALGKLAPAFLSNLQKEDPEGFYKAFSPLFLENIDKVNLAPVMTGVANLLGKLVTETDDGKGNKTQTIDTKVLSTIKEAIKNVQDWYSDLKATTEAAKNDKVSPEMEKLNKQKAEFAKQQMDFETTKTKAFQTEVASECEKHNNTTLRQAAAPFLKMPFFKGFPKETMLDLGAGIKTKLFAQLKGDKAYQAQMKAMWGSKSPDRAKITAYHNAKVDSIAEEVVRSVIQNRYPGYAKGGAAAGRVAAANDKKTTDKTAATTSVTTGKPIYVATKPKWDAIDFEKDPQQLLYIAGKAYLKGGKFVTWRK